MRILALLFLLSAGSVFGQKSSVVYKTIASTSFSVGDRIAMGEITTERLLKKEYAASISEAMSPFRDFMFAHPEMQFRVHAKWKQTGRKFPAETQAAKDSIESYFRKHEAAGDNKQYAAEIKHAFFKQPEEVKLELEIITISPGKSTEEQSFVRSENAFPDKNTIYRNYDNTIAFNVPGVAASEAIWIEGDHMKIKYLGRGKATIRVRLRKSKELVYVTVKSGTAEHPVNHGRFWLKVSSLPEPEIFLGPLPLNEIAELDDSTVFQYREFFASYPNQFPLSADFKISEVRYVIAGKEVSQTGPKISAKTLKKIEAAPAGTEIIVTKVVVNGPRRMKLKKDLVKVKSTPAGTVFPEKVHREFRVVDQPNW